MMTRRFSGASAACGEHAAIQLGELVLCRLGHSGVERRHEASDLRRRPTPGDQDPTVSRAGGVALLAGTLAAGLTPADPVDEVGIEHDGPRGPHRDEPAQGFGLTVRYDVRQPSLNWSLPAVAADELWRRKSGGQQSSPLFTGAGEVARSAFT
jgi:hypothetical protein